MKHIYLLLCIIALASCKKERDVRYDATCDDCVVWFADQSYASGEGSVVVRGEWFTVVDTAGVIDSTYTVGRWSRYVTLEGIKPPQIRARNDSGSCTIRMGGKSASTDKATDVIGLY